jgi:hypothetical protein
LHLPRDPIPGDSDLVIVGHTDSAHALAMEEAVCRLKLAADAGADVCFIGHQNERIAWFNCQRPRTETRAYYICHGRCGADLVIHLFIQVLVNLILGGLAYSFTTEEAEQMVARIIFIDTPAPCYLPAYQIDPMEGVESVGTVSEDVEMHGYPIFWTTVARMGDGDLGF